MGTLEEVAVVGLYVLILLEIHLLDLDGNHKGCNCSLIWLHLFLAPL